MPLYLVFAPDKSNVLDKRLELRPAHKELSMASRQAGTTVLGRALMSDEYTHHANQPPPQADLSDGKVHPGFAGSVMIYRFSNIEQAWGRLRKDPFYQYGVWDTSKITITELDPDAVDDTVVFAARQ